MSFLAFLVAVFCFLIAALAPVFNWNLGDFNAIAWGLVATALGLLFSHRGEIDTLRR